MSTKWIQKVEQYAGLIGKVFDSLTNNSSTDAPSIRAVNEKFTELSNKMDDLPTKEHTHKPTDITGFTYNESLNKIDEITSRLNASAVVNNTGTTRIRRIQVCTIDEYDKITSKVSDTLYVII